MQEDLQKISAKEAAKELGYAPEYVAYLCRSGKLVAERREDGWAVDRASLEKYKRDAEEQKELRAKTLSREWRKESRESRTDERVAPVAEEKSFKKTFHNTWPRALAAAAFVFFLFFATGFAGYYFGGFHIATEPVPFISSHVPATAVVEVVYRDSASTTMTVPTRVVHMSDGAGISASTLAIILGEMHKVIREDTSRIVGASVGASIDNLDLNGGGGGSGLTLSDLTDANIPDTITAINYLPLAGGTLTGLLTGTGLEFDDATTTNATTTNLAVSGTLSFNGVVGTSWSDFCTSITGGAGLCDGADNTGGGGLATSTDIADTWVIYGTSASDVGAESAFTYDDATNRLTVVNASTTALSTAYASSTNLFAGALTVIGNTTLANATTTALAITTLTSTLLKTDSSGNVIPAIAGTDYVTNSQLFAYPFGLAGNATSTLTQFNGGLTSYASTTIGAGAQATGLTISGGATTTGNLLVSGSLGVGGTNSSHKFFVTGGTSVFNNTGDIVVGADSGRAIEIKANTAGGTPYVDMADLGLEDFDFRLISRSDLNSFQIVASSSTSAPFSITGGGRVTVGTTTAFNSGLTIDYSALGAGVGLTIASNELLSTLSAGRLTLNTDYSANGGGYIENVAGRLNLSGSSNGIGFFNDTGTVDLGRFNSTGLGIGTTTPFTKLTVGGSAFVDGNLTATGTITFSSLNSADCDVKASTSGVLSCGTDATGTSSVFPFTPTTAFGTAANATSTLIGFTNGIYALASSTIGDGTQAGGLTISGGATTTGNAYIVGNVGIGDTSPADKLSVVGSVGVGPNVAIDAPYNLAILSDVTTNNFSQQMLTLHSDRNDTFAGIGTRRGSNSANIGLSFWTWNGSATGERVTIDPSGSVGIGTTSPSRLFNVYGTSQVVADFTGTNATAAYVDINAISGDSALRFLRNNDPVWSLGFDLSNNSFGINSGSSINGSALTILTNHNIGIGSTTPYYRLSVEGSSSLGNQAIAGYFTATSSTASMFAGGLLSLASTTIGDGTAVGGLTIAGNATTTGNLIIGTSEATITNSSLTNVSIFAASTGSLVLRDKTNDIEAIVAVSNPTYAGAVVGAASNHDLSLVTNATTRVTVDTGGLVGINDATPSFRLDVNGSGRFTGALNADASLTADGNLVANAAVTLAGITTNTNNRLTVCSNGAGGLSLDAAGNNCDTSSLRFKHDIEGLDITGLEMVMQMKPSSFVRNETEQQRTDGRKEWGFIAEEIADVNPHLALYEEDGTTVYSISKYAIMAVLADAVQELNLNLETIVSTTTSTTPQSESFAERFMSGLFARMSVWLASAQNGLADLFVTTVHAEALRASRVETDELCVGEVCVTEEEFLNLVEGQSPASDNEVVDEDEQEPQEQEGEEQPAPEPVEPEPTPAEDEPLETEPEEPEQEEEPAADEGVVEESQAETPIDEEPAS